MTINPRNYKDIPTLEEFFSSERDGLVEILFEKWWEAAQGE